MTAANAAWDDPAGGDLPVPDPVLPNTGFTRERRAALRAVEKRERAVEDAMGVVRVAEAVVDAAAVGSIAAMKASERLATARRRLASAEDALVDARADLDDTEGLAQAAQSQSQAPSAPQLFFHSLPDFVTWLCVFYRRPLLGKSMGLRWESRWFESREAVMRLDALWRAFESLRLDGATGISVWLRDHVDYHMGVLMSESGPFSSSRVAAEVKDPLPCDQPPPGMFQEW